MAVGAFSGLETECEGLSEGDCEGKRGAAESFPGALGTSSERAKEC